jgi:hypothetical protein
VFYKKRPKCFRWKLEEKIEVERKEPFKYALLKKAFSNVHQVMDANTKFIQQKNLVI